MSLLARFLSKLDKRGPTVLVGLGPCHVWTGCIDGDGYGRFMLHGVNRTAHSVAYEDAFGAVESGFELDHLCRNRACCNVLHIEKVTKAINIKRGNAGKHNAAKTHCPQGHEYTPANIYLYRGYRACRTCRRERDRRVS